MIDSIRADVATLATPAGRLPGTAGHRAARAYLVRRLREIGLVPYDDGTFELRHVQRGVEIVNVVGVLPGPSDRPVLLVGAHYDTVIEYAGADDNAAAVAIALASATELYERRLPCTLVVALFDCEEPPHYLGETMGSVVFYERQRRSPITAALIMDLVGHDVPIPGLEDLLFIMGMESDPRFAAILTEQPPPGGLRIVASLNRYVGDLSDHHAFRLDRRPYLFLSCGRSRHYHEPSDTPDTLNYEKIGRIAGFVTGVLAALCHEPPRGPFEGYDSTPIELRLLRENLGPLARRFGIELATRADIDRLIARLLAIFQL